MVPMDCSCPEGCVFESSISKYFSITSCSKICFESGLSESKLKMVLNIPLAILPAQALTIIVWRQNKTKKSYNPFLMLQMNVGQMNLI